MKNVLSIFMLVLGLTSCNSGEEKEKAPSGQGISYKIEAVEDGDFFPTLELRNSQVDLNQVKKSTMRESPANFTNIDMEVRSISPFPPISDTGASAEQQDKALKAYRQMVNHFDNDELVRSKFKTSYSRKLLLDYNLLSSVRFKDVQFATDELIESKMGNYSLILKSLKKLKGHIEPEIFNEMVEKTNEQIRLSMRKEIEIQNTIVSTAKLLEDQNLPDNKQGEKMDSKKTRNRNFQLAVLKNEMRKDRHGLLSSYLKSIQSI